jgi:hypothetical protein
MKAWLRNLVEKPSETDEQLMKTDETWVLLVEPDEEPDEELWWRLIVKAPDDEPDEKLMETWVMKENTIKSWRVRHNMHRTQYKRQETQQTLFQISCLPNSNLKTRGKGTQQEHLKHEETQSKNTTSRNTVSRRHNGDMRGGW